MNNKIGLFEVVLASFTGCAIFCKLAGFIDWRWVFVVGPYVAYMVAAFILAVFVVATKKAIKKQKERDKERDEEKIVKAITEFGKGVKAIENDILVSDECTDDGK